MCKKELICYLIGNQCKSKKKKKKEKKWRLQVTVRWTLLINSEMDTVDKQ
jgi:hypothetical protein